MSYNFLHFFAIYSLLWRAKRASFLHFLLLGQNLFILLFLKIKLPWAFFLEINNAALSISFQKFK